MRKFLGIMMKKCDCFHCSVLLITNFENKSNLHSIIGSCGSGHLGGREMIEIDTEMEVKEREKEREYLPIKITTKFSLVYMKFLMIDNYRPPWSFTLQKNITTLILIKDRQCRLILLFSKHCFTCTIWIIDS